MTRGESGVGSVLPRRQAVLAAWVVEHCATADDHGVLLTPKRGAPEVKWNLINP